MNTRQILANRSFMGEKKTAELQNARITLIGGGLDIESALISLIGLGVGSIQHFDNFPSRSEPSFLAPFSETKKRINWRLERTINNWFPTVSYQGIAAPPIKYLINEFKPNVIITNKFVDVNIPTIYTQSSESQVVLSTEPITDFSQKYEPHTRLISGALAADEARKRITKFHGKEELILEKTYIPLTKHSVEKKNHESVLIVGAGGIGTYTALSQTLSQTKNISIIDPDVIEDTNLNRQLFYAGEIGKSKAEVLATRLHKIYPFGLHLQAKQTFHQFIRNSVTKKYDVIFCSTDNYESRLEVASYCEKKSVRLIEAGCTPTTSVVSEYVPNITKTITKKRSLVQSFKYEKESSEPTSSCTYAKPSIITPNLISGVLQSYFSNHFLDSNNKYHRLQKNFCFNSHLASKFYEE